MYSGIFYIIFKLLNYCYLSQRKDILHHISFNDAFLSFYLCTVKNHTNYKNNVQLKNNGKNVSCILVIF